MSFLASKLCPVHKAIMASYYGSGGTGPREGHDKRLKLYRKVLSETLDVEGYPGYTGMEALVLSKVPELKERIEGEKNRLKKKEFLNVLKFLVEKSQIDHIWSSACDAPPNCIHEWGPVNNHFKDFKYQQAKLRRYGATVARVSAKWMDECIIAEGKCLSLV